MVFLKMTLPILTNQLFQHLPDSINVRIEEL